MVDTESQPPSSWRILVVHDSEHDRRFICRALAKAGELYETVECPDGPSALERLERENFDLVLVDLNMPGMDGLGLIRQAQPRLGDAGVIILTGARSFEAAAEAVRLQVTDYIL